jgi:tRNA A-37 threonylcarbamoyl transferase component Bud32
MNIPEDSIYQKKNVEPFEAALYQYICQKQLAPVPLFIEYNPITKIMKTIKVEPMNLADMYTDDPLAIHDDIFNEIKNIVRKLFEHGIVYPDITAYNFIEDQQGKIWIIDFGHAFIRNDQTPIDDWFIRFINDKDLIKSWNPNFE